MYADTATPLRIKTLRLFAPLCAPVPLVDVLKILSINNGILSFCQRNNSVGCVQRLNNCMSFHAVFHRSSSQGLLKFNRYFITDSCCASWILFDSSASSFVTHAATAPQHEQRTP